MRLIDADALYTAMKQEWWDDNGIVDVLCVIDSAPTIDAISMREWSLLRNSIKELQENNTEKKDIQFVTKFLLGLMDISERRDKGEQDV